jgi:lysophospholipase L1-like esterase
MKTLTLMLKLAFATVVYTVMAGEPTARETAKQEKLMTTIPCDDVRIALAPYVWKRTGSGDLARAEATMPGAYLKVAFLGSSTFGLLIDGIAYSNCPASCLPVVDYSVDDGPFKTTQLSRTGEVYVLPLAQGLEAGNQHRIEFYFRAGSLDADRWVVPTRHLRIAGVQMDADGTLAPVALRANRAIAFGDSITEGVNVDGTGPYYSNLFLNNARGTWFPIVCAALDCEYGQLGTGGQGMVTTTMPIPPLPQTWDHYDAATSRLTNGLLEPEPDYIYCEMGTNDFEDRDEKRKHMDITATYLNWLLAVRKSCPNATIFCITPPLGWHASEILAVVKARNSARDRNVYLIDTAPLKAGFKAGRGATTLTGDGVHPTQYGNAMLGAFIAVETRKILNRIHY